MLSDEELVAQLDALNRMGRRLDARVILLLIQVEDRRLDRRTAYPSLYEFCRGKLGMSEGTANRRVTAARLVRQIPAITQHLEKGTLSLSALMLVKSVLTQANLEELVAKVAGKTRDQIEELVACMAPKPDVEARLRLLPARPPPQDPPSTAAAEGEAPAPVHPAPATAPPKARLAPLSEARWRLQLTADRSLRDRIERARSLMRHRNPSGDLTVIVSAAIDALLEKLEAPRKAPAAAARRLRASKHGAIAAATRRAVFARDGEQCTYRDASGERCKATTFLELDHIDPRARGGSGEAPNLRVRCRAHNLLAAEEQFGRSHIERRIRGRREQAARARSIGEPRAGP